MDHVMLLNSHVSRQACGVERGVPLLSASTTVNFIFGGREVRELLSGAEARFLYT